MNYGQVHHIEYYVNDLKTSNTFWSWFMPLMGYSKSNEWSEGVSWAHSNGTYLVFVQVQEAYKHLTNNRQCNGLNHIAFMGNTLAALDMLESALQEKQIKILKRDGDYLCFEDPNGFAIEVYADKNAIEQPRIETNRLILEPYKDSDVKDVFAYASNPKITQYVPWSVHKNMEDAQKFLDGVRTRTSYMPGKLFFIFAIRLKETGRVIGSIDFKNPQPWIGQIDYALSVDYWNKGIMTEAARAVKSWAETACPKVVRLQAGCLAENKGSSSVMEKLGMKFEGIRPKSHYWGNDQYADLAFYSMVIK